MSGKLLHLLGQVSVPRVEQVVVFSRLVHLSSVLVESSVEVLLFLFVIELLLALLLATRCLLLTISHESLLSFHVLLVSRVEIVQLVLEPADIPLEKSLLVLRLVELEGSVLKVLYLGLQVVLHELLFLFEILQFLLSSTLLLFLFLDFLLLASSLGAVVHDGFLLLLLLFIFLVQVIPKFLVLLLELVVLPFNLSHVELEAVLVISEGLAVHLELKQFLSQLSLHVGLFLQVLLQLPSFPHQHRHLLFLALQIFFIIFSYFSRIDLAF